MNQPFATDVKPPNPETDFNLLTIIGCAEYDREAAEDALGELFRRHVQRLKGSALSKGWEALGVDVDELVITTFEKIWNRAGDFDPAKTHHGIDAEAAVSLWIYKIFENGFRDRLRAIKRARTKVPQVLSSDATVLEVVEEISNADGTRPILSARETHRVRRTREWLDSLSEGDRMIMLLSADYINPATGECEIPSDELEILANRLGLAPASIKVKRGRMKARLREFISDKEKTDTK